MQRGPAENRPDSTTFKEKVCFTLKFEAAQGAQSQSDAAHITGLGDVGEAG